MKYDCGFTKGNHWFRYRTGTILLHEGNMLFVKSKISGYFYMIGGGVHLGETAEQCAEREFLEETGICARAKRLAVVCENFFKGYGGAIDGLDCHTLEFYFVMEATEEQIRRCKSRTDDGEELVWLPVDVVARSEIKPSFVGERIHEIIHSDGVLHVVEERDR